jgi:hypothetical protein
MQTSVVNFTKQTTTGNQSITGAGFTPLAYIMFASDNTRGSGNTTAGADFCIGMSDGSTSNAKAYSMANRTATMSDGEYSDNAVFLRVSNTATVLAKATHSGFTSDGCTINWSTNDSSTFLITVIFFGGTDLVDANVGNFGIQQTTGSQTVSTGIGGTPQFVFVIPHGTPTIPAGFSDGGDVCWGAATANNQFGVAMNSTDTGTSTESSNTYDDTFNFIIRLDKNVNAATIDYKASFTAFTSNGFTINVNKATTYGNNRLVSYLLLSGAAATCKFKIMSINKNTTTGAQAITGAGFTPLSTMFSFTQQTTHDAAVSTGTLDMSIGAASSASNAGTQCFSQVHGSQSTNCDYCAVPRVIAGVSAATTATLSTISNQASLTSLDADGCTINWDTNDGKAENMDIIFFGITAVATGGGGSTATNVVTQGANFS